MGHFIKRGVTIYSFKELVATGQMTWGDCIARLTSMGVTGMELLGQLFSHLTKTLAARIAK